MLKSGVSNSQIGLWAKFGKFSKIFDFLGQFLTKTVEKDLKQGWPTRDLRPRNIFLWANLGSELEISP